MPENPPIANDLKTPKSAFSPKRMMRIIFAIVIAGVILWQIAETEHYVRILRSRGFEDFAISSVRMHAYFPLIGSFLGAVLFIVIGRLIRRSLNQKRTRVEKNRNCQNQ